ncbi:hypothetical protein O7614_14840 [Micromonospora sp. WMMD961]|uniref:hypothetical protein n=1 Tax=Micromonospora sp. WMMD961 TaxID=3016100 RepID=UPI0024170F1E|nr:hypothetical protein [Micromonospora sp. WMMD961]MDG4780920.1 hypothetical protein [Micromonospora sp. WMMD961]
MPGVAACAVAGAWVALGYGLLFSPDNAQVWGDLEAGGRFAATIFVYLPYYVTTLPVAVVFVHGRWGDPDLLWPLAATTGGIGLFA